MGVVTVEPCWVLYDSNQFRRESEDQSTSSPTSRQAEPSNLSPELFPALSPLQFTRRAREWAEKWPVIQEVRLYAGKGPERPYVLVFILKRAPVGDFWTDSLIKLQTGLQSVYRDPNRFVLSQWQLFTVAVNEELPVEFIHPDSCWRLSGQGLPVIDQQPKITPKKKRGPVTGDRLRSLEQPARIGPGWLTGRKEIAKFLGLSWPTIKTYKKKYRLPISYTPTKRPVAIAEDLKAWLNEHQAKKKRK